MIDYPDGIFADPGHKWGVAPFHYTTRMYELMIAQLRNQDPFKAMDPSQFLGQLAQFGTVNGIEQLNTGTDISQAKGTCRRPG